MIITMKNFERFFGLHFDFHAGNEEEIGVRTNPKDIEWYINETKPDFVQFDCKGHPGNASYPSKIGNAADNLKTDNLKIWRDTVKKNGLPVFVHYSGVLDERYVKLHPEAAAADEENNPIKGTTSVFSDYADQCLIPQLKELIEEYGIDGAWIDGECWAVRRDFSENVKPYLKPGMTKEEHDAVMRRGFLDYLKHYIDEIHKFKPDFKITSNWAYSSYIPEKPEIALDFISGDYPPNNSVHEARFEGRCIAAQNMPWDLMSWSFFMDYESGIQIEKSAEQMKQEAAMVLSLGGGFQLYITQNRDGSARVVRSNRFRETADFVHERRLNFKKKIKSQVGVFYSAESKYKMCDVFNPAGSQDPIIGMLNCILDAQYTANIVLDYQTDKISEYDIIVVPEWEYMSDKIIKALLGYAKDGGNLIIAGAELTAQIGKASGKVFGEIIADYSWFLSGDDGNFAGCKGKFTDLRDGNEFVYFNNDIRDRGMAAYSIENYGKGRIAFIPFDLGSISFSYPNYIFSEFLKKVMSLLDEQKILINKKCIDITVQEGENDYLINLINMNQSRHDLKYGIYKDIQPINNIEVRFKKTDGKISMPFGEKFECKNEKDYSLIKLDKLDIHSVIKIEK